MNSYEVHGLRVSSSAVREALAARRHGAAPPRLLGRPYSISGHVVHGRKLGRALGESAGRGDGFRTLNLRFAHPRPAAMGIFVVRVHGLADEPLPGVASLGVRPDGRRRRPRAARNPLPRLARRARAAKGATVNSSAWNCCTNCTTKRATTALPTLAAAIAQDAGRGARLPRRRGRDAARDRVGRRTRDRI